MATKAKSETVKMRCVNKRAGKVGSIATPLKEHQEAWEKAGWALIKEPEPTK